MSILDWILFGLAVGVVARLLMAREDPGGLVATILLGIGGALVGGFLGRMLERYGEGNPVDFGLAVLGGILVVFLYRTFSGRSKSQWKEASPEPTEGGAILDAIGVSQTERRFGVEKKKGAGALFWCDEVIPRSAGHVSGLVRKEESLCAQFFVTVLGVRVSDVYNSERDVRLARPSHSLECT